MSSVETRETNSAAESLVIRAANEFMWLRVKALRAIPTTWVRASARVCCAEASVALAAATAACWVSRVARASLYCSVTASRSWLRAAIKAAASCAEPGAGAAAAGSGTTATPIAAATRTVTRRAVERRFGRGKDVRKVAMVRRHSTSSSWPPTGLADGFEREVARRDRPHGRFRFTPVLRWVPGPVTACADNRFDGAYGVSPMW